MLRPICRINRSPLLGSDLAFILAGLCLPVTHAQQATPVSQTEAVVVDTFVLGDIPLGSLQNEALPDRPIADDRGMLVGGIGSDLWHAADDPANEFWMVTDRGPNGQIEVDGENRRTFPVPDFTPLILHVRAENGTLTVHESLPIVNQAGAPVTGLPNLEGVDEAPYDFAADNGLAYDQDGLDTEGLVRTADGSFRLADEYRPSLLKVDSTGKVLARYLPAGVSFPEAGYPVEATLPAIYASRKINRGFEGLALSGDGQTIYAVLQSPLLNPDKETGDASRASRILAVDTATGKPIAEYVYWLEAPDEFDPALKAKDADEVKLSGIVWLDEKTLMVLERTDEVGRFYAVDLAGATDILGSEWDDPAAAPSLETLDDPDAAGVTPLPKTLVVDLEALPDMPDKIEGVTMVDDRTIAVANDNDFAIGALDDSGRNEGPDVKSQLLIIEAPLP